MALSDNWMLRRFLFRALFFLTKNFTLQHSFWLMPTGTENRPFLIVMWLFPLPRAVPSIECTPQENVTVAVTVLFCVYLAVGSLAPSILLLCLGVCVWYILPQFEYISVFSYGCKYIYIYFSVVFVLLASVTCYWSVGKGRGGGTEIRLSWRQENKNNLFLCICNRQV